MFHKPERERKRHFYNSFYLDRLRSGRCNWTSFITVVFFKRPRYRSSSTRVAIFREKVIRRITKSTKILINFFRNSVCFAEQKKLRISFRVIPRKIKNLRIPMRSYISQHCVHKKNFTKKLMVGVARGPFVQCSQWRIEEKNVWFFFVFAKKNLQKLTTLLNRRLFHLLKCLYTL